MKTRNFGRSFFFSLSLSHSSQRCCQTSSACLTTEVLTLVKNPSAFPLLSSESQQQLCSCRQPTSCLPCCSSNFSSHPPPPRSFTPPVLLKLSYCSSQLLQFSFISTPSSFHTSPSPPATSTSPSSPSPPAVYLQFSFYHTGGFSPLISDGGANAYWVQYKTTKKCHSYYFLVILLYLLPIQFLRQFLLQQFFLQVSTVCWRNMLACCFAVHVIVTRFDVLLCLPPPPLTPDIYRLHPGGGEPLPVPSRPL